MSAVEIVKDGKVIGHAFGVVTIAGRRRNCGRAYLVESPPDKDGVRRMCRTLTLEELDVLIGHAKTQGNAEMLATLERWRELPYLKGLAS